MSSALYPSSVCWVLGALVGVAVLGAGACDSPAVQSPVATVALEPFAQHSVRLSERGEVAVTGEMTACVVDSYESAVVCYDAQGTEVAVWGREGEGPGEFPKGGPGDVLRIASDRLGTWSSSRRRLSVFRVDGVHILDFSLNAPGVFAGGPMSFRAESEGGERLRLTAASPTGEASFVTVEFDLATQRIVWEQTSETLMLEGDEPCEGAEGTLGSTLRPGAIHSNGSLHYFSCDDVIVYLPEPKGDRRVFLERMPTYREEYPNEQDIASERRAMRFLGAALDDHIDEYQRTPRLFPALGESARAYDAEGRLWIGTRTMSDSSEVDLYDGADYIGTVRIRDVLLGLDILDSTLVALVERRDSMGIPNRGVDWYTISRLPFSRRVAQDRR